VQLDWQVENGLEAAELSPKQALELTQFLREAVSNALKHAHPACVAIRFARDAERLQVSIGNDGDIQPPERWQAGTGLSGMKARIRALRGDLQVRHLVQQGYVRLDAAVPLLKGVVS
jgi:signal transduction histidine kinase